MKKEIRKYLRRGIGFLGAFGLWTLAVQTVDVQAIGPQDSSVGFATVNGWVHQATGVHLMLYTATDWLSLVPVLFVLVFGLMGLAQWIKRKKLFKVDHGILALGGFYVAVMASYVLFEIFPVNYRPVLVEGVLEVSYPSSTTMLVLCVMTTGMIELRERIRNGAVRCSVTIAILFFTIFMVMGRLLSGVHWFTDIIGGVLLSMGLLCFYCATRKF